MSVLTVLFDIFKSSALIDEGSWSVRSRASMDAVAKLYFDTQEQREFLSDLEQTTLNVEPR